MSSCHVDPRADDMARGFSLSLSRLHENREVIAYTHVGKERETSDAPDVKGWRISLSLSLSPVPAAREGEMERREDMSSGTCDPPFIDRYTDTQSAFLPDACCCTRAVHRHSTGSERANARLRDLSRRPSPARSLARFWGKN